VGTSERQGGQGGGVRNTGRKKVCQELVGRGSKKKRTETLHNGEWKIYGRKKCRGVGKGKNDTKAVKQKGNGAFWLKDATTEKSTSTGARSKNWVQDSVKKEKGLRERTLNNGAGEQWVSKGTGRQKNKKKQSQKKSSGENGGGGTVGSGRRKNKKGAWKKTSTHEGQKKKSFLSVTRVKRAGEKNHSLKKKKKNTTKKENPAA